MNSNGTGLSPDVYINCQGMYFVILNLIRFNNQLAGHNYIYAWVGVYDVLLYILTHNWSLK